MKNSSFIGQFSKISVQALKIIKTRFQTILNNLFFFAENSKFFQKFTVLDIAVLLLVLRRTCCVVTARVSMSNLINAKTQKIMCTSSTRTAIFTAASIQSILSEKSKFQFLANSSQFLSLHTPCKCIRHIIFNTLIKN